MKKLHEVDYYAKEGTEDGDLDVPETVADLVEILGRFDQDLPLVGDYYGTVPIVLGYEYRDSTDLLGDHLAGPKVNLTLWTD